MNVSIIGLGFVGKAMYDVFLEKGLSVRGYDINKAISKNTFEECMQSDIIFLALPTPYDTAKKEYLLDPILETCTRIEDNGFKGPIIIKSTLTPQTISHIESKYNSLNIVHNPEFLTARTAKEDFKNQKHIVLGRGDNCNDKAYENTILFYKELFPDSDISLCTAAESESMKIFVNSFYAVKVQFFTELYLTCKSLGIEYDNVVKMMLKNGWINPMHTKVPGPDKQISYGGYCLPKDTIALNDFMKKKSIQNSVLNACVTERDKMREDKDNIL